MLIRLVTASILLLLVPSVFAQGTFKPRNADEEHAWRLYNQYTASKKKEAEIRTGITQTSGDIKTVNVGSVPGLGIDPADVARLGQLREQLAAELDRQKKLENAWDKKFWGRYGDLSDSSSTIYDPKTKTTMDKIRFRLIAFPFYVHDGTYSGSVVGAPGSIRLVVTGSAVTGSVSGVYKYTLFDQQYSDPYKGTVKATIDPVSGKMSGSLTGSVGGTAFTGTITGAVGKLGVMTGSWTTKAGSTAKGTFTARRN